MDFGLATAAESWNHPFLLDQLRQKTRLQQRLHARAQSHPDEKRAPWRKEIRRPFLRGRGCYANCWTIRAWACCLTELASGDCWILRTCDRYSIPPAIARRYFRRPWGNCCFQWAWGRCWNWQTWGDCWIRPTWGPCWMGRTWWTSRWAIAWGVESWAMVTGGCGSAMRSSAATTPETNAKRGKVARDSSRDPQRMFLELFEYQL